MSPVGVGLVLRRSRNAFRQVSNVRTVLVLMNIRRQLVLTRGRWIVRALLLEAANPLLTM